VSTAEEKVRELEKELRNTPYNKATVKHIGILKARIARLRKRAEKKRGGKRGQKYSIKKAGDATVLIIGFPSVGKSTLLNALTNAESPVSSYDFTTLKVVPGMMKYKGTSIQVLDVPGVVEGASSGKGMGKQVMSVVRNADLLLILVDDPSQLFTVEKELWEAGIRLDRKPPGITLKKKEHGGVSVSSTSKLSAETRDFFKRLVLEYGIYNADVLIRGEVSVQDFTDFLDGNKKYVPCIRALNKIDAMEKPLPMEETKKVDLMISARTGQGLDALRELIFRKLGLTRVFMKKIGEEPDVKEPLVLLGGGRVKDLCKRLHEDFLKKFSYARVWGPSARFDGQRVGLEHALADGDVVELHLKR